MIHLHHALLAILTAPEPAPRPDVVPEDLDPDLLLSRLLGEAPGLLAAIREDRGPLPNVVVNPPPDLPEAPYTAPPNRAQRRAKRRAHR
jgi:hypothetical protein